MRTTVSRSLLLVNSATFYHTENLSRKGQPCRNYAKHWRPIRRQSTSRCSSHLPTTTVELLASWPAVLERNVAVMPRDSGFTHP